MFRRADGRDAVALRDLEKAANLVALAHVFPPEVHPYPDEDVLERWQTVLADRGVTTIVSADEQGLTSLVAFDQTRLRHLAVRPDLWSTGLARDAIARSTATRLWCLEANQRARRFYEKQGWVLTGASGPSEFPPYPVELEYQLEYQFEDELTAARR